MCGSHQSYTVLLIRLAEAPLPAAARMASSWRPPVSAHAQVAWQGTYKTDVRGVNSASRIFKSREYGHLTPWAMGYCGTFHFVSPGSTGWNGETEEYPCSKRNAPPSPATSCFPTLIYTVHWFSMSGSRTMGLQEQGQSKKMRPPSALRFRLSRAFPKHRA
jgi:hypothetical protein